MSAALKPEVMDELRAVIKDLLLELLPTMIKEVTPIVSTVIKEITPIIVQTTTDTAKENNARREHERQQENETEQKFQEFVRTHKPKLDEVLHNRYKLSSSLLSNCLRLKLFDESLQKTPEYIPKEFRKDDYYVNDAEELHHVTGFQLARLKAEREIAAKRKAYFLSEIDKLDEEAAEIINNADLPLSVEEKALLHWKQSCERDQNKLDEKNKKQESSTREAYAKDELFWRKHQVDRLKKGEKKSDENHENESHDQGDPKSHWADVPEIELVVVPDDNISDSQLSNAMNNGQKNENHPLPVHPPGAENLLSKDVRKKQPPPPTTRTTRQSERSSSISQHST